MTLTTHVHLSFDGRCEAAFEFYERRLGAKVEGMFKYEGSPMAGEVPPGWEAKVMHASIRIGGLLVMGSDVPPERYERPAGFQVMLATADAAGARRERRRLKVCQVYFPLTPARRVRPKGARCFFLLTRARRALPPMAENKPDTFRGVTPLGVMAENKPDTFWG